MSLCLVAVYDLLAIYYSLTPCFVLFFFIFLFFSVFVFSPFPFPSPSPSSSSSSSFSFFSPLPPNQKICNAIRGGHGVYLLNIVTIEGTNRVVTIRNTKIFNHNYGVYANAQHSARVVLDNYHSSNNLYGLYADRTSARLSSCSCPFLTSMVLLCCVFRHSVHRGE